MTERFFNFLPFIFKWEGESYEDVQGDPGGPTKYGIDQRSHPHVDIKSLTKLNATQIYYDESWVPNSCEAMPRNLGECHMDACVNCGVSRAKTFLSQCNGSAETYIALREAFYKRLAQSRKSLAKFLKGWLTRTEDLKTNLKLK